MRVRHSPPLRPARARSAVFALAATLAATLAANCTCVDGVDDDDDGAPPPRPRNGDPLTTALDSEVRRLSQAEIDRTLALVIGDQSQPAARLLLGDTFTPYDNNYLEQQSSAALVDALDALATDVAVRAVADDAVHARVVPCVPAAVDDEACFRAVVAGLGRRLLRRPLGDDEVATYLPLLAFAREESPHYTTGFDAAVEVAVRAFLLDPEFLFRIEVGTPTGEVGVARLNPFETATRMSFLLWGSGPDDALLDAAAAGGLDVDADRAAVAAAMLTDDKAKAQLSRFHAMWLGYRAIPIGADLSSRFAQETDALLTRVVFDEQRPYTDAFTLEEAFVDDALADHYGLPRPTDTTGTSPNWVSTAGSERAGLLGTGAVLASFSKFTDTSPTQRGILVKNRLMCQPIDPPPPNVNADQPPPATGDAECKIDRYLAHTASTSCNDCHRQMDPIGFGLENFDIQGRFRTHDDGNEACVIDGVGELPGFGVFHGPKELAHKIVDEEIVGPCLVEQVLSFSHGRPLSVEELAIANAWYERFVDDGERLDQLMLDQIAGEQFVTRRAPTGDGVQP